MDDKWLARPIGSALDIALQDTPVVCLLGPRQVGKSSLARRSAPERTYLDLDNAELRTTAIDDPLGFINSLPEYVTLDEIQRAPELMRAIKISVDNNRKPGRFILTGSANLLLLPQLSDSLAGRMEIIRLHPLTESEKAQAPGRFLELFLAGTLQPEIREEPTAPLHPLSERLLKGGYPEAYFRDLPRAQNWQRQYLQSIIERDVQSVAKVRDVHELTRLLEVLAHQTGSLLNISNLSRDLSLARVTVDHYLSILERLFLIRRVSAWHRNGAKRLVKSAKVHFVDSGLCSALLDLDTDSWNTKRQQFGSVLESFIIQQLVAQAGWTDDRLRFWHYRDKDQAEVDCVITKGSKVWGIQVKAARSVKSADAQGLRRLAAIAGKDFQGGIVFYNGNSILPLGDKSLMAMPISKLWEL
jgi:predicted AAA+ superfamily ATPase